MGRRSRKRRDPAAPARPAARPETTPGTARDTLSRGYARSRERDERIRADLEPLAPGERPGAVTVAAIVALLFGVGNIVLWAAGVEVSGERPAAGGTFVFAALMFVAAWGMWQAKYWAVVGFEALLALILIVDGLALFTAKSVPKGLGLAAIFLAGGWLFWKLIRAMARLQMPAR
jgi:hypothetical protein